MADQNHVRLSKWMSLVLRHDPAKFGVVLDEAGWTRVDDLIAAAARAGVPLDDATLRRRVLETEIADDPAERARQLDENPGLWLRLHPNVRSLILPDVLAG